MLTPAVQPIADPTAAVDRVLDGLQPFCPPGLLIEIELLLADAVATHPVAVNLVRGEPSEGPPSDVMSTPVADNLTRYFAARACGRVNQHDCAALARAGLQEAIETFAPEDGAAFECYAWVRIYKKLIAAADPGDADARELVAARNAAFEILELDEGDDGEGEEPAGDRVERLETFCSGVATAMLLAWASYLKRNPAPEGR